MSARHHPLTTVLLATLVLACFSASSSDQGQCHASHLAAHFSMKTGDTEREVILWRNGSEIGQQYPRDGMTITWKRTANGGLRQVRHFDAEKRSIEFEPDHGQEVESNWVSHFQILNDAELATLTLRGKEGFGCDEISFLEKSGTELAWLNTLKLPKHYVTHGYEIRLVKLEQDPEKVEAFFRERAAYQTTDYADIGDSENDPFLQKMINLGFIEHHH